MKNFSYLNSRCCKVWNLKFNIDGWLDFTIFTLNTGQVKVGPHQILLTARECLDVPDHTVLLGHIFTVASGCFELGTIRIWRHWYPNFHIVGSAALLELTLRLDHEFDSRVCELLNNWFDPEQRLHLGVQAVGHELEVTVWRNEGNRAVVLKTRQSDALMEFDIL